jgi:hypothetical protein
MPAGVVGFDEVSARADRAARIENMRGGVLRFAAVLAVVRCITACGRILSIPSETTSSPDGSSPQPSNDDTSEPSDASNAPDGPNSGQTDATLAPDGCILKGGVCGNGGTNPCCRACFNRSCTDQF